MADHIRIDHKIPWFHNSTLYLQLFYNKKEGGQGGPFSFSQYKKNKEYQYNNSKWYLQSDYALIIPWPLRVPDS